MAQKDIIATVMTIAVLTGGWLVYRQTAKTPDAAGNPADRLTAGTMIGQTYAVTVAYANAGFSPSTIVIPKGGAVIFKNSSSKNLNVASNPHPLHGGYPAKDGCIGSAFDSCSDIPPGVSWSFTFDYSGEWGYHNHLNPAEGGTVTVQ